jgi:hypothetical protein
MYPIIFLVSLAVGFLIMASMCGFIFAFVVGSPGDLTREEHQLEAPTAVVMQAVGENKVFWWDGVIDSWLTPSESEQLRNQYGVANLVILHADGIQYAASQTAYLNENWEQKRPFFIEAMSLLDTGVVVQIDGRQYHLNAHMPFVWKSVPDVIAMVDHEGRLWSISSEGVTIESLDSEKIPLISPNPKLELSFAKN